GSLSTVGDMREQGYSPLAMRYLLLSVPYRKQLNFTFEGLQGAESTVERLRNFRRLVGGANPNGRNSAGTDAKPSGKNAIDKFETAMDDDLNTAAALAAVHDL